MFVPMALVTTFTTTPILNLMMGKRGFADDAGSDPEAARTRRHPPPAPVLGRKAMRAFA